MTHLSDKQFEDILQGAESEPEHLAHCQLCHDRLAERHAVSSRLRSAFDAVRPSKELSERISEHANRDALQEASGTYSPSGRTIHFRRWFVPLTAVAAVLLIGIPVIIFFTAPGSARAAQAELFQIHQNSLSGHTELYSDADPNALAAHLKNVLGFKPALPRLGAGMSLRGCCVAHFRNKPVGSYVVDTPRGVISIIVVTDKPRSLGMADALRRGDHTYGAGSFARCEMVTLRLDGYTYCAVGEVSRELLADLLEQLVW